MGLSARGVAAMTEANGRRSLSQGGFGARVSPLGKSEEKIGGLGARSKRRCAGDPVRGKARGVTPEFLIG
jgi:hypothetical protein